MADYTGADATVQATNDSSIVSKASCAALGYFEDPYVGHVAVRGPKGRLIRRAPLVHRCYYVRHLGTLQMQEAFLRGCISPGEAYNVVVLGAGFDTGALRRSWPKGLVGYYEVEFPAVLARKQALLARASVPLPSWLHQCGADLRNTGEVTNSLRSQGADFSLPTLLLAEVVLAYLEPGEGDALASWAAATFPHCLFGMYEQLGPHDPFGRFMRRHFISRQCPLRSLLARPDLRSQRQRFAAFPRVDAADCMSVLAAAPREELQRAALLEPFDEYEEFHLKCSHYFCLAGLAGRCAAAPPLWSSCSKELTLTPSVARVMATSCIGVPRFAVAAIAVQGQLLVCGGHGICDASQSETHGRQTALSCAPLDALKAALRGSQKPVKFGELGHHCAAMYCTIAACGTRAFVFGGRLGPSRPSSGLSLCTLGESASVSPQMQQVECHAGAAWPCARWRHSATLLQAKGKLQGGSAMMLVLGGLGEGSQALGLHEAWLLDTNALTWHCMELKSAEPDGAMPVARHSHAAAVVSEITTVICGGLDSDGCLLGDTWALDVAEDSSELRLEWRRFKSLLPRPRYGHALHIYKGHTIVVGGIDGTCSTPPLCIDGSTCFAEEAAQQQRDDQELFMWHNNASVLLEAGSVLPEPALLVLGGGGNCFSFGTHLNQGARLVPLSAVLGVEVAGRASSETCCAGISKCTVM